MYVLYNAEPGSTQRLQVYQAISRCCVGQTVNQELSFNLRADDVLVAAGCVVSGEGVV